MMSVPVEQALARYEPMIRRLAGTYIPTHYEDLCQIGRIAVWRCAERANGMRDGYFSRTIEREMRKWWQREGWLIRRPAYLWERGLALTVPTTVHGGVSIFRYQTRHWEDDVCASMDWEREILRLPTPLGQALWLVLLRGLSYSAAARALGLRSGNGVRARVTGAVRLLRERLSPKTTEEAAR
jgi:DNA-directed RNA polymerase specialized sigma24 family protein